MKTNMLLLDNKIMKEDTGSTTITPAPVPAEDTSKAGMKALSFMGMKNLMANPKLAQGVGVMNDKMAETSASNSYVAPYSSNIAFKQGGMKNAAKIASVAAIALAAAAMQSCKDTDQIQNQYVYIDLDALAAAITNSFASLRADIEALKTQLANQNAALIAVFQNAINQLEEISAKLDKHQMTFEQFKAELHADNSAIIEAIVNFQNVTKEEAKAQVDRILNALEIGQINEAEAMKQIMALIMTNNQLLGDILSEIKNLVAETQKANEQRDALLTVAKEAKEEIIKDRKTAEYQRNIMINQLGVTIQQNFVQINYEKSILKAVKEGNAKLNATIYEVANDLGLKIGDVIEAIKVTGKSEVDAINMTKADILAALETHLAKLETMNNNLIDVNNNVTNNTLAVEDAADQITEILNKISDQLDALSQQFADAVNMFRNKLNQLTYYAKGCFVNGQVNNTMLANLNQQIFALRHDVTSIKLTAKEIRNNIQNGVAIDYNQLEEMFKILNMHQTESKDEILAKLDVFIANQESLEAAINKLGDENNSRLDYIACLIKNKSTDNADVIEAINNLAQSNETNINAATEALAAKLDVLISKVDAILNKMGNIVPVLKQYGDQILAKFSIGDEILAEIKKNGNLLRDANGKLDLSNKTLAELKAIVEDLKPQLQQLNNSATIANNYLDIIAKKQVELKDAIENINIIGGGDTTVEVNGGITKEELEELWKKHDANAFATAKAYIDGIHADDIAKADEIIALMKQGNKTAGDTYQLLLDWANKNDLNAEQLRKLIQAIYDYLPELKCHCDCKGNCDDNNTTHEGIIDIIS